MRINDLTIYLGDNGRALCGQHLGTTARYSGRDLYGTPLHAITPEDVMYLQENHGYTPECETCGRRASLLEVA